MFEDFNPLSEDRIKNKKNSFERLIDAKAIKRKYIEKIFQKIGRAGDLHGLPAPMEKIRVITQKTFTSTDFVVWISEQEKIIELNLAVYRMNNKNSAILKELHRQQNFRLNIVLSSFFRTCKKSEVWHDLIAQYARDNENTELAYCSNHSKIMCVRTADNFYVIEGSGNMGDNSNIEQYVIDNCSRVFEFHSSWIKALCQKTQ